MGQKTQNHFLKFFIHLSVIFLYICPRKNYRQIYGKSKASLQRNFRTGMPPKFFSTILCFVALVYNSFFFQNSCFTEIIRHQILIQTLSKSMTRSIDRKLPGLKILCHLKLVMLPEIYSYVTQNFIRCNTQRNKNE